MDQLQIQMDFDELYKIRIRNYSETFAKHEIVKLLIVKNIINKYKRKPRYQLVYTEYSLQGRIVDVFHHNKLSGETYTYEIQRKITKKWEEEVKKFYKDLELDLIIVDLNKLSDNIKILNKQIKNLVI